MLPLSMHVPPELDHSDNHPAWWRTVPICACAAAVCKVWRGVQEEQQMTGMGEVELAELPAPGSPKFAINGAPEPVANPDSSSRGGVDAGAIIGGCVAAAVLFAVMAAFLLLRWRRRLRHRKPAPGKPVRHASPTP